MALESGARLYERYRIERTLGRGGFGAVYLATDESLGLPCAIKENLNLSPEAARQFKREATLLAALRHPNLTRVTNHFLVGNQQYLVMDYVEGEDLRERLARGGRLPEAEVLGWAAQICDALTYLHSRTPPVIHRDLKPANVKLTGAGEAMLVDFGLAKAAVSGQQTTTGALGLTSGYAPPEQYGMGGTDARTDEYALAATLYHLLTGEVPPDSVERLLGNARLTPLHQLRPDLTPHVADALTKALAINPDERFVTVADFKAALLGQAPVAPLPAPAETTEAATPRTVPGPTRPGATLSAETAAPSPTTRQAARAGGPRWLLPISLLGLAVVIGILALGYIEGLPGSMFALPTATAIPSASATPEQSLVTTPTAAPTSTPTAARATDTPTPEPSPTATPAPTPTPSPVLISVESAASWRRFAQWSSGGSSPVVFALSPDGRTVAFPKEQGIDIFDLVTGETMKPLQGFIINRRPLAVAHLGTALLVQFEDEILRWDIETNRLIERFPLPGRDMVVSPNGSHLAVRDKYVTVLDLVTRRTFTVGREDSQQLYAFSPDGRYLVLTNGLAVELYNTATGQLERRLNGHGKPTSGLTFSRDGSKLISASGDVWELPVETPTAVFDSPIDLRWVALSPDGQVIVGNDGTVWDASTGAKLATLPGAQAAQGLAFTPDGLFVVWQSENNTIELWGVQPDAAPQETVTALAAAPPQREVIGPLNVARLEPLTGLGSAPNGVAFSADGRTLAAWSRTRVTIVGLAAGQELFVLGTSGGISNTAYLGSDFLLVVKTGGGVERWDLTERRLKQRYDDLTGFALEVSPDGRLFALQDKYIQVVEVLSGRRIYPALGTADSSQDFEFTPDGRYLAIASRQSVGLWDMQTGQQLRILSTHGPDPKGLVFTPDGSRLVSSSGDVWDLNSPSALPIATFASAAEAVAVSPDGALIAGDDGSLWDGSTGQYIGRLDAGERLADLAFTPDGQYLLWRTASGTAHAWGIRSAAAGTRTTVAAPDASRQVISSTNALRLGLLGWWGVDELLSIRLVKDAPGGQFVNYRAGQYAAMALHPNGNLLAGLTRQGAELLDLNQGTLVGEFSRFLNAETITEAAYLGDLLLVVKEQAGVELWDLAAGELRQRYNVTGEGLVVSPNGLRFAIYKDGVIQVVDAASGGVLHRLRAANAQGNYHFSPDGRSLALADGVFVGLWNMETGRRDRNLRGHTSRIVGTVFTPDGKYLVAASGDVWDLESGQLAATFTSNATRIALSPDGQTIVGSNGAVWETATGQRLATLTEMRGPASRLAFAAGGRLLLWQANEAIYVWGVRPAAPSTQLPSDASVITAQNANRLTLQARWGRGRLVSALWSPDDKYLAVNTTHNTIFYDGETLKVVRVVWDAAALAFDASGRAVIGGPHALQVIDVASGEVAQDLGLRGILAAAFSPDGKLLAVGGQMTPEGRADGLGLIELSDGLVAVLDDSLGFEMVTRLEFSPDSTTLVASLYNTVSLSGAVSIWNAETRSQVRALITRVARPATLSPDGRLVAYFSGNGNRFVIENLLTGGVLRNDIREDGTPFMPSGVTIDPLRLVNYAYLPDGRLLGFYQTRTDRWLSLVRWTIDPSNAAVTFAETPYRHIDLDELEGLYVEDYAGDRARRVPAFGLSAGGTKFFSLTADGIVRLWNLDGRLLASSPADYMERLGLSPDGRQVALANAVGGLETLDLNSGEVRSRIEGSWYPDVLAYNSSSVLLALSGADQLMLLDLGSGGVIEQYAGDFFRGRRFVAQSLDGRLLALWQRVASTDVLNVFSLSAAQPLHALGRFPQPNHIVFSPDARYLAVVRGAEVQLWDMQTGQMTRSLVGQGRTVGALAFSADGTRLVAATGEIWDVAAGTMTATYGGSPGVVALSPNGQVIAASDGSLWEASTGLLITRLEDQPGPLAYPAGQAALNLAFTPDGRQLVRQTQNGVIEVWGITP